MVFYESLNCHLVGNCKQSILLLGQVMWAKEAKAILHAFCYAVIVFILPMTSYAKNLLRLIAKKRSYHYIVWKYVHNLRLIIPYKSNEGICPTSTFA